MPTDPTPAPLFPAFPKIPADVADYRTAITDEEALLDGPEPWDLGALPEDLASSVLSWLDDVCRWLNRTYAWQPHQTIPPCWRQHDHLAYEIAALAFARADAYREAGAAVVWHEQHDRLLHRINTALGKAGEQCRVGRHEDRPARYQIAAWRSHPTASAISALKS